MRDLTREECDIIASVTMDICKEVRDIGDRKNVPCRGGTWNTPEGPIKCKCWHKFKEMATEAKKQRDGLYVSKLKSFSGRISSEPKTEAGKEIQQQRFDQVMEDFKKSTSSAFVNWNKSSTKELATYCNGLPKIYDDGMDLVIQNSGCRFADILALLEYQLSKNQYDYYILSLHNLATAILRQGSNDKMREEVEIARDAGFLILTDVSDIGGPLKSDSAISDLQQLFMDRTEVLKPNIFISRDSLEDLQSGVLPNFIPTLAVNSDKMLPVKIEFWSLDVDKQALRDKYLSDEFLLS